MRANNIYKGYSLRKALGILALILSLAGNAGAATWTVDDSGGANFTRIQDAIDNASDGDTILVYSGTYYENVKVGKKLTIKSASGYPDDTIVQAANSAYHVFDINADYVIINGFTVKGATGSYAAGIYIFGNGYSNISNNKATNNDVGIYLYSSSNNTLNGNNAENNSYGIWLNQQSNNNVISENNADSNKFNHGIYLVFSNNNLLRDNTASNNWFAGIYLESSDNNMLNGNNASYNGGNAINLYYANNNILINNTFANSITYYGIALFNSNNNIIYNNYFNNTNNAEDNGNNIWNTTKILGKNIIGGSYLGGNYWSDYAGSDLNGDGLGDTLVPYNSSGNIAYGGDFLPLVAVPVPIEGSISGYKINDTNGNGRWEAGEKGISNWTIRLIGIIGKGKDSKVIRKETFTDAMGFYKFDNLPAGRYFVIEKLKKGFVPTSSPVKRIKLAQDENSMNNNFTNRPLHSRDRINGQRDIDDYEVINRDIDKYKEDMEWN